MSDLAFYEAGCHEVKGKRRVIVPFRRLLRRLLRPMFLQLEQQLDSLARRQNQLDRDLKAIQAMGWDQVALSRRLAMLEDHVETLLAHATIRDSNPLPDGDQRSLIRYPRLEKNSGDDEAQPVNGVQAKI